jgi:hypothetical protein
MRIEQIGLGMQIPAPEHTRSAVPLELLLAFIPADCRMLAGWLASGMSIHTAGQLLGRAAVHKMLSRMRESLSWATDSRTPDRTPDEPAAADRIPQHGLYVQPVCRPRSSHEVTRTTGRWHIDAAGRFHPWDAN